MSIKLVLKYFTNKTLLLEFLPQLLKWTCSKHAIIKTAPKSANSSATTVDTSVAPNTAALTQLIILR